MGKGGRCPETRAGRYARCETPKPSWGSSALRRTLESRVLRKAHARFGEGRMEKCSWSNSPAAYSTDPSSKPPDAERSAPSTLSASRFKVPRCRSPREPANQSGLSNYLDEALHRHPGHQLQPAQARQLRLGYRDPDRVVGRACLLISRHVRRHAAYRAVQLRRGALVEGGKAQHRLLTNPDLIDV